MNSKINCNTSAGGTISPRQSFVSTSNPAIIDVSKSNASREWKASTSNILQVRAIYSHTGLQPGDLSFESGQVIQVSMCSTSWCFGSFKTCEGGVQSGLFSKDCVELLVECTNSKKCRIQQDGQE